MFLKVFLLILLSCLQTSYSAPKEPPEQSAPLEVWTPLTWWIPFGIAQAETWSSYLKAAQEASVRLNRLIRNYIRSVRIFNRQNGSKQKETGKGNQTTTKDKPGKGLKRRRRRRGGG